MGLFNFKKKKVSSLTNKIVDERAEEKNFDFEQALFNVLDVFFEFKKAYGERGNAHLSILLKSTQENYSDTFYTKDYFLQMKVRVSDWWENCMALQQGTFDTFEAIYNERPDELTFIYNGIGVGTTTCCFIDWDKVSQRLHQYLDKYEKEHPGVCFEKSTGGARLVL